MEKRIKKGKSVKKPDWIRGKFSFGENYEKVKGVLKELDLNTVCDEAACPNKGECWDEGHATFMILGDICTRKCLFCNVSEGEMDEPDTDEGVRIARAVKDLGIKYAVITSVTRDDLDDRGAEHFVKTVKELKKSSPDVFVELLIPDFDADEELLRKVASSGAEVIGHNVEMPEGMYPAVRPRSDYQRSMNVLKILSQMKTEGAKILIKSSLIIGLGEGKRDIIRTLEDLEGRGVDIVYIGQYLSPTGDHWPVNKYYTPEEFKSFEEKALKMGFSAVCSGPMVRSSYRAYQTYLAAKIPS